VSTANEESRSFLRRPQCADGFSRYNKAVETVTTQRLLDLNRQFYQTFALQFSATRQRLQPGVRQSLEKLPPSSRILDLGCGNGELARALAEGGQRGLYVGIDFSPDMISEANRRAGAQTLEFNRQFIQADLAAADWEAALPGSSYEHVLAFAVLHHLPGAELRLQTLHKVRRLLSSGGRFVHSEWQFLNSPRMSARLQPWEAIGLEPSLVDPGDYLLDWRHGGSGLRYVHLFDPDELADLAENTGFQITETFLSDGKGGNLGLYQVWELSST
jgi:tRNA (uracil-5-)-methyltransferase TRM9